MSTCLCVNTITRVILKKQFRKVIEIVRSCLNMSEIGRGFWSYGQNSNSVGVSDRFFLISREVLNQFSSSELSLVRSFSFVSMQII